MRYSLTFREEDYACLTAHLFPAPTERAAYMLCGLSVGPSETKLLVREVIAVDNHELRSASCVHLSIPADIYVQWLKRADESNACLVFAHSHPGGEARFSPQDDAEEPPFFRTAQVRIKSSGIHGSIVLADSQTVAGRAWLPNGSVQPLECIRIIGRRFRFIRSTETGPEQLPFWDRQIRAFGREFQPVLKRLRVAVVGAGGTGSSVSEQLIRLGVGHLTVIDGGKFESSNINRVYGSYETDDGLRKPLIVKRLANTIGLTTEVIAIDRPITFLSAIECLKDCDIVFGCTDDQWGRSLLTTFALHYLTPVFDLGIAVDSADGVIERVEGRVTTLMPGAACLYCRNRISPQGIRAETMQEFDPTQAEQLRREGYLIGLPETAPSVITFTTTIASSSVTELLHRLTGFMGSERTATEVIHRIDWSRVRTNSVEPSSTCRCANREEWGVGDTTPMLGVMWRPEE